MLTEGYSDYAERLVESCRQHNLPHVVYEVPTIHQSISPKGTADPCFTKANFIYYLLETYKTPVLYIDVDCYIAEYPEKIENLIQDNIDFAIYNWLADKHTESYCPQAITLTIDNESHTYKDRFYRYSHSIDHYSTDQLICSGIAQFYNNTDAARVLLGKWHNAIMENPGSADDKCLGYTFNNCITDDDNLRVAWLDKAYSRYAWWIYERPVINHPETPYGGDEFKPLSLPKGKKYYYLERTEKLAADYIFPQDCLIDTETRQLLKMQDGRFVPWKSLNIKLWL